jgi:hypothetical protein
MGRQYNIKDITGQKFHHLTAINFEKRKIVKRKSGRTDIEYYWNFLCECGITKCLRRDRVTTGKHPIISCGCKINKHKFTGYKKLSGSQWGCIKKGAEVRKIPITISIVDAWNLYEKQHRKCALTGQEIYFSTESPWYEKTTASLDRIDSSKGYEIGNIQWVHKDINWCKTNYSMSEFINICKKVVEYQKQDDYSKSTI